MSTDALNTTLAPAAVNDALRAEMTKVAHKENAAPNVTMPLPAPAAPKKEAKLVSMELKRHYRPIGPYEIVGHTRPAKTVKNGVGEEIEVVPEKFIEGEVYPPIYGGVGLRDKIWAGTTIRVPEGEAKVMKDRGIAERGFHD